MPQRYDQALFRSTHNSFSGDDRRSLKEQLDGGVRCVELDLHAKDHERHGFRLGHWWIGDEVSLGGGNPGNLALTSWLDAIAKWSSLHHGHAPITLVLDLKDDLTRRRGFTAGNFAALNHALRHSLGEDRLVAPAELREGAWPALEKLRDRVIVVLSGELGGRLGYLRDGGLDPAVSIGDGGTVVELHGSQRREIWYWTGQRIGERVAWERHGPQGGVPGAERRTPAVAIAAGGRIVAVHVRGNRAIECCVGRLDDETLDIEWGDAETVPVAEPSPEPQPRLWIRNGAELRLVYECQRGTMVRTGALSADGTTVDWNGSDPATPDDTGHRKDLATRNGQTVSVTSVPLQGSSAELRYRTESGAEERIRYSQLAFVEGQWGHPGDAGELRFFAKAANAEHLDWAKDRSAQGKLVRLWDYDTAAFKPGFKPNFAATNHPFADWYDRYSAEGGTVET